jgi:predicted transporter
MEVKSLIVGLVFSVGVFAIKSGAGLSFLMRGAGLRRQVGAIIGYTAVYGLVFFGVWLGVCHFDIIANFDRWMLIFRNGMSIHLLLATLLMIWGLGLLRAQDDHYRHGWLLLALPCPVCLLVIFISGAFLHNLMPDNSWLFLWLAAGFIGVAVTTGLVMSFWGGKNKNHNLGYAMLLAAAYFLVTIAVVPQFNDLGRIYRLSKGGISCLPSTYLPLFAGGVFLAWACGFANILRGASWK